jgi:hypothetical protein
LTLSLGHGAFLSNEASILPAAFKFNIGSDSLVPTDEPIRGPTEIEDTQTTIYRSPRTEIVKDCVYN